MPLVALAVLVAPLAVAAAPRPGPGAEPAPPPPSGPVATVVRGPDGGLLARFQVPVPAPGRVSLTIERDGGRGRPRRRDLPVAPGLQVIDLPLPDGEGGRLRWTALVRVRRQQPGVRIIGSLGRGEEQFTHPQSIATGSGGRLWVVDSGNDRLQVLSARHDFQFEVGGFATVPGVPVAENEAQRFDEPVDAVQTINRDVYVTDRNNHRVVRLDRDGRFLGSFGKEAGLRLPRGIASSSIGDLFVADTENDRIQVFDRDGRPQRQIGTYGWGPRQLRSPWDVSVGPGDDVFVADTGNDRVQVFDQFGRILSVIAGPFRHPVAVRVDQDGLVWIVDDVGRQVLRSTPDGRIVERLAAPGCPFDEPTDVLQTDEGHLYVVDRGKSALVRIEVETVEQRFEGLLPAALPGAAQRGASLSR